jgi:hypothetical protein
MGVTATTTAAVSRLLGRPVTFEEYLGHKGRAVVARLRLDDGSTVVAKGQRSPDEPVSAAAEEGPWSAPNRFRNEVAALRVLGGADGLVPALLADDVEAQWMVLEDVGPVTSLADALLADDPAAAAEALCGWARALGRLHRRTADAALLSEWAAARRALGGAIPSESASEVLDSVRPTLADLVVVGDGVAEAAREIDRRLGGRDWWALTPRDACPDNCARRADGSYLLFDFEGAGARHALLDAAYLVSTFPTCWCTGPVPAPARARALEAYRAAAGWPHDDAAFGSHLSAAAAFHVLWVLERWLPRALAREGTATVPLPDVDFVFPSSRAVVALQLADLRRALTGDDALAPLADLAGSLQGALAARWGALELPAPHPAFARP